MIKVMGKIDRGNTLEAPSHGHPERGGRTDTQRIEDVGLCWIMCVECVCELIWGVTICLSLVFLCILGPDFWSKSTHMPCPSLCLICCADKLIPISIVTCSKPGNINVNSTLNQLGSTVKVAG